MKKLLVFIAFLLAVSAQSVVVSAQTNMWNSEAECLTALNTGNYLVYSPKFFTDKDKNPVNGTTKIVAPLPSTVCMRQKTFVGFRWVVQTAGTLFRWNVLPNGTKVLYARDDCGNESSMGTSVVAAQSSGSMQQQQMLVIAPKGDRGKRGKPGEGCTIKDNGDGTKTITCGKTTAVIRDGSPGSPGVGCSIVDNGNGTKTVTCGESVVTLADGRDGKSGWCSGRGCKITVTAIVVGTAVTVIACVFKVGGLCKAAKVLTGGKPPGATTGPAF